MNAQEHKHPHPHTDKPLATRIWAELQKLLAHEKSPYLAKDKFVLQKDAFVRLADDEVESDVPWLTYEHNEPTSDEALDFSLYFFAGGFILNIGPTTFEAPYVSFAFASTEIPKLTEEQLISASPHTVAANIVLTIKLLLNGQLALGCHWRGKELMAIETFLLGYETKPYPIAISGQYTTFKRAAFDYAAKQNKLISDHVKVTDQFPLLPPIVNGTRVRRGRTVDSIHDLEPLTKKAFDDIENQASLHEYAGKETDASVWSYFYRTIEFWVTTIVVISLLFWLKGSPQTPAFLHSDWLQPVYILASWTIIPFVTSFWLGWRQNAINAGASPLTYQIEQRIGEYGYLRGLLVSLSLSLIPIMMLVPFWTPKDDFQNLFPATALLGQFPALLLLPVLNLAIAVLAAIGRLYSQRPTRWAIAILAAAYTIGFFTINGVYMNTADNAPTPSDFVMAVVVMLPIVFSVVGIVAAWRRPQLLN